MKKQKLEVIVITGHELTKEERKNYKRDHPGYRLAFWLRYPDFPLYMLAIHDIDPLQLLFYLMVCW